MHRNLRVFNTFFYFFITYYNNCYIFCQCGLKNFIKKEFQITETGNITFTCFILKQFFLNISTCEKTNEGL